MKATGIVRRIDDLGRIVIPKEIRRTQRIHEGDPIEIYTNREGEIMLKKYSPLVELGKFASDYAESIAMVTGGLVCVTDRENIIAAAGPKKKEYLGKDLSKELENLINNRVRLKKNESTIDCIKICENDEQQYSKQIVSTIITNGDCMGAVVLCSGGSGIEKSDIDMRSAEKKVQTACDFLGKQLE